MANSSLLDEPVFREQAWRFSVEQYQNLTELGAFDKNVELLEGIIVKKMSKSPRHEFFTATLIKMLERVVPAGYLVREEKSLACRDSVPEPDAAVVLGELTDFLDRHPTRAELVIEVALSSAEIDHRKKRIYAAVLVPEYWIVLPAERCVKVCTLPFEGEYTDTKTYVAPQIVTSEIFPSFELNLANFFPR